MTIEEQSIPTICIEHLQFTIDIKEKLNGDLKLNQY